MESAFVTNKEYRVNVDGSITPNTGFSHLFNFLFCHSQLYQCHWIKIQFGSYLHLHVDYGIRVVTSNLRVSQQTIVCPRVYLKIWCIYLDDDSHTSSGYDPDTNHHWRNILGLSCLTRTNYARTVTKCSAHVTV